MRRLGWRGATGRSARCAGPGPVARGPGGARRATAARPGQTPPGSPCREGCRETAETAAAANRAAAVAGQGPQTPRAKPGPGPARPPAASAPGCGCGVSGRGGWWHSRGATPDRAHRATPAALAPGVRGHRGRRAGCRGAAGRPGAAPATAPAAAASRRWGRRRGRPPPAATGPDPRRWRPATAAGRSPWRGDPHRCRSELWRGPAARRRCGPASETGDAETGWWHSKPACGCKTNAPPWPPPPPAGPQQNRSCRAANRGGAATRETGCGCRPGPAQTAAAAKRCSTARNRSPPRGH